jgi:hypothetical protein
LIGGGRGLMLHEPDLQLCRKRTCIRDARTLGNLN